MRDYQTTFRLAREHQKRFETAAVAYKKTKQELLETALFAYIDSQGTIGEKKPPAPHARQPDRVAPPPTGMLEAVNAIVSRSTFDQTAPSPPTTPTIVQHFGPSGGAPTGPGSNAIGSEMIDFFASYVVGGDDFEQSRRIRECVKMFKENASTAEETNTLIARLEEAVALKKNLKQSNVVRAAKMAFNKFAHFLSEKT